MKAIYWFDLSVYFRRRGFYAMLALLMGFALLAGAKARFSLSDDLLVNSPYQLSFLAGFLSLLSLFFSPVFASQLLFREADARFELMLFSTPLAGKQLVAGRFLALFTLTVFSLLLFALFFFMGQASAYTPENAGSIRFSHYLPGFLSFVVINTLFTNAVSATVGWLTRNKLMVYISGLFMYMVYMLALLFSGSPFMAQSMPQTEQAQLISAIADPFGLSAFFYQTASLPLQERNTQLIVPEGLFLCNRLAVVLGSALLVLWSACRFSYTRQIKGIAKERGNDLNEENTPAVYRPVTCSYQALPVLRAFFSFVKINLTGILKSASFVLVALFMLFYTGMELYAEIEKGIRIPQKYATSGLMTETILQNFHGLCVIVVLYDVQELFWKSRLVHVHFVEESAALAWTRFGAQWFSLGVVIVLLACLQISEGVIFQLVYGYPWIEWQVYSTVFLFSAWPLILLIGLCLLIQRWIGQRYIGLTLTAIVALLMATPLGKMLLSFPLLKFMQTIRAGYSDMNGFGPYQEWYAWRLAFGTAMILLLFALTAFRKRSMQIAILFLSGIGWLTGITVMQAYLPKDAQADQQAQASYELSYRKYGRLAQPLVTHVATAIELFPDEQAYRIVGVYVLENKNDSAVKTVLVNFPEELKLMQARWLSGEEEITIEEKTELMHLRQALLPGQKAKLEFVMSYEWKAINGHQSFNAIVENGSFMRISRYYPQLGYQADKELADEAARRKFKLGAASSEKTLDAPPSPNNDFIRLDMILSTKGNQAVIGIGELVKQWQQGGRHYAHYRPLTPVPFRFALSSATYAVKKDRYKGKAFEIWYHPSHVENVEHLMANMKQTMDYCEANFGPYPFATIRFAEVSAFTRGFAATAYPATVFMTEDMVFHANIKADEQQDVINELAGHELSHLWWGNSQISPDGREGSVMLTESFAMYTELMLLKRMYGGAKAKERALMHLGIYNSEKGFSQEQPLYKVQAEQTHISYSRGAVIMYRLSRLIGEEKLNLALRHFLEKYKYPSRYKPLSTDFIAELYQACDSSVHAQIDALFMSTKEIKEEEL